ncbi:MAG: hypothetical protein COA47_02080 [Robiginitomaculum sp.]|nr:MAG: hypothetical protein COA47_02080 [Robiginitomaculum sp.]
MGQEKMGARIWQLRQKWGQWFAALLLHGALLIGLALMPKPDPDRLADKDNQPKPVTVIWVSPPAETEPVPARVETSTPEPEALPKSNSEPAPDQPGQKKSEIAGPVTPAPAPVPEAHSPSPIAQSAPPQDQPDLLTQRRSAATLLFLGPTAKRRPGQRPRGNIFTFLQTVQCGDMDRLEPKCRAYRRQLANVHLAYGRAVMRAGAAIGAKYRLMDDAELATAFGLDPRYDGPAETLYDSSMDPLTSSSGEIRERLGHWPPDPVFGD